MSDEVSSIPLIGRIALFNGPPSSGKTSLVNALQEIAAEPWFHLSLDDYHSGIIQRWWLGDDGQLFVRLISGYLGSLHQMALAGINVMAEAVIIPERRSLYQDKFGDTPIVLIGVNCPLDVAMHREQIRSDRRIGPIDLPAAYFESVRAGLNYDLEVASDTGSPTELAATLLPEFNLLAPSRFESHLN
jgi:chloramphenicol 3-O phosphotransferase